jgi:hypothetical protein
MKNAAQMETIQLACCTHCTTTQGTLTSVHENAIKTLTTFLSLNPQQQYEPTTTQVTNGKSNERDVINPIHPGLIN